MQRQIVSKRTLLFVTSILMVALCGSCRLKHSSAGDSGSPLDSQLKDAAATADAQAVSDAPSADAQSQDAAASVTWTQRVSGTTEPLQGVWVTAEVVIAVGDQGTIVRSTDAGQSWDVVSSPTTNDLRAVYGDGAEFFAVGAVGTILHSTDKGVTWQSLSCPSARDLLDVWGAGAAAVFVIDGADTLVSTDHGQSWETRADPSIYGFNAIWGASATDLVACADGGLYFTLDGAEHWQSITGSLSKQNDLWTAKPLGQERLLSVNNSGLVTYVDLLEDGGLHFGDSLSKLVLSNKTLWGIWGPEVTAQRDLFVVGDSGNIFHRIDNTWHQDQSGTADPLYDVHGTDSLVVAVGANGNICTRTLP